MNFPFMKLKTPIQSPYVAMEYDGSRQVVSRFLEAVQANSEDAWAFVSKVCSARLDLNALRKELETGIQHVKIATYASHRRNWQTHSVYVQDTTERIRQILHLHMVREPDHNGKWKIFGVEQEECTFR